MAASYFSRFPGFEADTTASANKEFTRLAGWMGWTKGSERYRREWVAFTAAEFETHYGTESTKLDNWQALCNEVGVTEDISSITKCKKALKKVHVNIIDLIDARRTGNPVKTFPSANALRNYTRKHKKIFSKEAAKREGFLKALLRNIF